MTSDPAPVQPGPYYVQASCELSEDYFLTADVLIGPDNKVVPFVNNYQNGNARGRGHRAVRGTWFTTCTATRPPRPAGSYDLVHDRHIQQRRRRGRRHSDRRAGSWRWHPNNPDGTMYSFLNWLTRARPRGDRVRCSGPGVAGHHTERGGASPDNTPYFYGWIHEQVKSGKTTYDNYTMVSWGLCNA